MNHIVVALVLGLASTTALGQSGIYKDQFLEDYPAGSVAVVVDNVAAVKDARRLLPLTAESTKVVPRRNRCLVAIAHRDPGGAGREAFLGVQIIKLFSSHDSPGVVYVGRNAGWLPGNGTSRLPELGMSEVHKASLDDFWGGHAEGSSPDSLMTSRGRLTSAWHARLNQDDPDSFSASELNRRFWARNPTTEPSFTKAHGTSDKKSAAVRVENHLIRFQMTADKDPSRIPSVHFDCQDARLMAVAIRVHLPASPNFATWGHLEFK